MTALRRILFPLRLARARLAAGAARTVPVAAGILAGSAAIAAVLGGRLVLQDRALARATAALAPADRSIEVAWFGSVAGDWRALDREVSALLGPGSARAMLYREAQIDGRLVSLRAADDLGRFVRLRSGRLPRPCVPTRRCEVLRLEGRGPVPSTPRLRLVQVGTATLRRDAPFAAWIQPVLPEQVARAVRYHAPQPAPVLIAEGVAPFARTAELSSFFRSYAWFLPVRPGDVHPWSVGAYARRIERIRAALAARSDAFEVTGPTDALAASVSASRVAARRLLLLGGEAGALLLAFTVLAAAALRREVAAARRRLLWAGARRFQVELVTFAETGAVALAGTLAGFCAGGAVAAAVASVAGSPPWPVVEHALLTGGGLAAAAGTAAVAALLLFLTVRAAPREAGRAAPAPLDVAALAAVVVVAVGAARGSLDAASLASGRGSGAYALLLPGLVTFAAAAACARLLAPGLRALGRAGRRGPLPLRLAALSLARDPGRATVTAAFLVASLGLALFALVYRATLLRGERDQATFAVPAPYVVDEDLAQLVPVLHGWPAGTPARPVIRLSGNVPSATAFTLPRRPRPPARPTAERLPLDPAPARPGLRAAGGGGGRRRRGAGLVPLAARRLPGGRPRRHPARAGGRAARPRPVRARDARRARARPAELRPAGGERRHRPAAERPRRAAARRSARRRPAGARGLRRLGRHRRRRPPERRGRPALPRLLAHDPRDRAVPAERADRREAAARARDAAGRRRRRRGRDRPARDRGRAGRGQDRRRRPALPLRGRGRGRRRSADRLDAPRLALPRSRGDGRALGGRAPADTAVDARRHLPGGGARRAARRPARPRRARHPRRVGRARPRARPRRPRARRRRRPPRRARRAVRPRGAGATPATLQRHLRLRALLVAAVGLLGGVATGAILSRLVLSLVAVTAAAAKPEPPLVLTPDWPLLAAAVALDALVAAAAVAAATRLRGRAPERAAEAAAA